MAELTHYLILSGVLFTIGTAGVLLRRNVITVFLSIEVMLNAVNLSLVTFSRFTISDRPIAGQTFVVFVLTVAAAEAAVALALAVSVYRNRETVDIDQINLLRS